MLLYHLTDLKYMNQILKDGKLKPASKTKNKSQNPYDFNSPYVYFNTFPRTQVNEFAYPTNSIGLIFRSDILLGKVFYINKHHTAGNTKSSEKYCVDTKEELRKPLYKIYKHSLKIVQQIKQDTRILSVFQEVFTKVEPDLNNLEYIILNSSYVKIIDKIKKNYPHVKIVSYE